MDYIKRIRSKVGHDPIIMAAAGVLIINEKNQVLLQHRSDNGLWGIPGGALELAESFEEAAIREVYEETGLKVTKLEPFGVYSGKKMYNKYPNQDEVYVAATVFICKNYEGKIKVDEESKALVFLDIYDIPAERFINPPDRCVIRDFKNAFK